MGLIGGIARTAVIAGTATAVSNRVSRRQYNRWAEQDQMQYYQPAPAPVAPAPAPVARARSASPDTMTTQLKQLADLKAQGVLSDQEFAAAKAKILR